MAKKVARLVDGPIVMGELQNTRQAWKCSDVCTSQWHVVEMGGRKVGQ